VAGKVAGKTQEEFDQVNQLGTRCLFEAIQESGQVPKRILLLSSIAAGSPSKPNCPVDEDSPPGPVTYYGKSKLKGELEALPFKDKFSICILRPPIIYGPADKAMFDVFRLVKRRIHIYVGVENQKISIIEISDLCRAVILCATHENADGQTFYVANPDSITWKELGRIIGGAFEKKYVNIRIPPFLLPALARISEWSGAISGGTPIFNRQKVPEALAPSWECNGEKIRRLLGFETSIGLEEGIVRTLEWYRANKWL
jgi:nucleoside-diphosphate-sugar epimerase